MPMRAPESEIVPIMPTRTVACAASAATAAGWASTAGVGGEAPAATSAATTPRSPTARCQVLLIYRSPAFQRFAKHTRAPYRAQGAGSILPTISTAEGCDGCTRPLALQRERHHARPGLAPGGRGGGARRPHRGR